MTLPKLLLVAATAVLLFLHPAAADEFSLLVAGIEMRLGMPKEPLLTQLRSQYKLTQIGGKDSYFIMEKRGDEYRIVSGVSFQDNKVSLLSRNWGTFYGKSAVGLANELHSAIENLQEAIRQPIVIYLPKTQGVPGQRFTEIKFLSGMRMLTLLIVEGDDHQISLQEEIEILPKGIEKVLPTR
jgi:hypothetical protein